MSMNRNKVVSLHKDYKSFRYGSEGFSMAYDMWVKEGGKLGDIYGNGFERDENGKINLSVTNDLFFRISKYVRIKREILSNATKRAFRTFR